MIFRKIIIVFASIMQVLSLYCQNETIKSEERYYDIDSAFVFRINSAGQVIYHYKFKDIMPCFKIEFEGGYKSLSAYCDSLYYNRDDYNYDELNARVMYAILFNSNLKIEEVKILSMRKKAYTNKKYSYDDLVKRILLSTEGKWYKTGQDDCEWYFRLGYFNLR